METEMEFNAVGTGPRLYKGSWRDGQRGGLGVMQFRNGDEYDGRWFQNKMHGAGTLYLHEKGQKLTGTWEENVLRR